MSFCCCILYEWSGNNDVLFQIKYQWTNLRMREEAHYMPSRGIILLSDCSVEKLKSSKFV